MRRELHLSRLRKTRGEAARFARAERYKFVGNFTLGFAGVYLVGNGINEFASGQTGWGMVASIAIGGAMIGDGFPRAIEHSRAYRKHNNEAQALAALIDKVENPVTQVDQ